MTSTTPATILDGDGYPTDETLHTIRHWTGPTSELVALLEQVFRPGGFVTVDDATNELTQRPVRRVTFVTGGWSGCENALTALERGFFWFAYWQSSHRGGKHLFEVPADQWDTEQPTWAFPDAYEQGYADGRTSSATRQR